MRRAVLPLVAAALVVLSLASVPAASADDGYDAVIYEAADGSTHIVSDGADSVLEDGSCLVTLSEAGGSYSVLMESGSVESLTLLLVDAPYSEPVSLSFTMGSGSVGSLTGVSALPGCEGTYASAPVLVSDLSIEIRGHVGELDPCSALVGVGSMDVAVGEGGSVDRLRSTGSSGVVSEATVEVLGGSVGYMANGSAVVYGLVYRLLAGTVDYLCLGSDTQSSGGTLGSTPTFCAAGTVEVSSTSAFSAGTAVVGAGVLDLPAVLSDGEAAPASVSRTVVVDAPGLEISDSSYFPSGSRALTFPGYAVGGTPSASALKTEVSSGVSSVPLYGDGGVWGSQSGGTVAGQCSVYLNTTFTVTAGSVLEVSPDGFLTNARFLRVQGMLAADGLLINNGVIELSGDGSLEGEASGSGYVAAGVSLDADGQAVGVMSDMDAVVVRGRGGTFTEARVVLPTSGATVVATASGPIDVLVVNVTRSEAEDGAAYEVYAAGYLGGSAVPVSSEVTVRFQTGEGDGVWVLGPDGREAEVLESTGSEVTFSAAADGVYLVTTEAPSEEGSQVWVDAVIVAAIVVLAAVIVHELLRRDRV